MASQAGKDKFRAAMMAATDKYVKQQGRNTIELNCRTDSACEGYVRVPGPNACEFCVTMGAQDSFYHTRESAGGGVGHGSQDDLYHAYCNCTIAMVYRRRGELVARDPDTGEAIPYDGASVLQRYREAGSPTFRKNRAAEAERRRARRRNGEAPAHRRKDTRYGARLSDEDFEAAMRALSDAKTVDELHEVADRIVASWPRNANGRNKAQWDKMSGHAKALEKRHKESNVTGIHAEEAWKRPGDTRTRGEIESATRVDSRIVDSKQYERSMRQLVGDRCDEFVESARKSLQHRGGTLFEDLYAINLDTGKKVAVLDSNTPQSVSPTKGMNSSIDKWKKKGQHFAMLHNHPESGIPSMKDIRALRDRGADFGIIVGHDGSIYKYSIVGKPLPPKTLDDDGLFDYIELRRKANRPDAGTFANVERDYGVRIEFIPAGTNTF